MRTILPDSLSHRDRHQLLLGGVAPRPIALVSSMDANGIVNLAPFSFFNAYASKPPIVAIGPAIAAKTGIAKDTWLNILATKECTINAVSYSMVHGVNLTSAPYPSQVDEFVKGGFGKVQSQYVKPPYVAESPFVMECTLMENIELRRDIGGNGNLMLLEVVAFHVAESVFVDGAIDPRRMDLVARMNGAWYTRTRELFSASQPPHQPIGMDGLPEHIRTSPVLTGNDLARLAYVPVLPMLDGSFPDFPENMQADSVDIELAAGNPMGALFAFMQQPGIRSDVTRHRIAKAFIQAGEIDAAWQTLLLVG